MEKRVTTVVSLLLLGVGLAVIINDIRQGHTAFGLYLTPGIFVAVALLGLFKKSATKVFNARVSKMNPATFINAFLVLFGVVGIALLGFLIRVGVTYTGGYLIAGAFVVTPLLIWWGNTYGFPVSKKNFQRMEARRNVMTFSNSGISISMPLFDKVCFVKWHTIDTILYVDYLSGDTDPHFMLYLSELPVYTKNEKQWWLNKLFPGDSKRKELRIKTDCKNVFDLPAMTETYLGNRYTPHLHNNRKGTLISSKTTTKGGKTTTTEHWKPLPNYESVKVIYDRLNRTAAAISSRNGGF